MKIILYCKKDCWACKLLEDRLKVRKIEFKKFTNVKKMKKKGFISVPQLEVDGKILTREEIERFLEVNKNAQNS